MDAGAAKVRPFGREFSWALASVDRPTFNGNADINKILRLWPEARAIFLCFRQLRVKSGAKRQELVAGVGILEYWNNGVAKTFHHSIPQCLEPAWFRLVRVNHAEITSLGSSRQPFQAGEG
jgi:hypothetical protein